MRRVSRIILQQNNTCYTSSRTQATFPGLQGRVNQLLEPAYSDAVAATGRGGIASTSGRTKECVRQSWNHIKNSSQHGARSMQEQAGLLLAKSLCCSSSGQNLLRLWPAMLLSSALTMQHSTCSEAVGEPSGLTPEQASREITQSSYWSLLKEEFATMLRGCYLLLLFMPVSLTAPFAVSLGIQRHKWLDLVVWTLERAGPAFIKWGQWAATRPDMFPQDLCQNLAKLQSGAPRHPFAFTRRAVETAFHGTLEELFEEFAEQPVASGSIAQIHKARLSDEGARGSEYPPGTVVAVKVRHPGVTTLMQRDFTLMHRAAKLSSHIPVLSELHLEESIRQFGAPLKEQLDLLTEAKHLDRFGRNFRTWHNLSFPAPVYPLVAPSVLVETFEEGRLISSYVDKPTNKYSIHLANIGLSCYLQMLLKDNFVHADLHPGNILVRLVDPNTRWGRIATFLKVNTAPKLVLLDVGMVAELTPEDQQNLVGFFKALTSQDGEALGENILSFSEKQTCPDPAAFIADMRTLFSGLELDSISEHTSEIISDMMEKIRVHQVNLKGVVSTVVVTTMVLEGWSTKLNPDIKIMDALRDILPMSWNERIARTVDKQVMSDAILGL